MSRTDNSVNYPDMVRQAQLGNQESMERLTVLAQGRVFAYIYRLTLDDELSRDLSQETLLEMVRSLKKLEHPEAFWRWLFRTALGKVQHHFREQQYKRTVQMSMLEKERLFQRALRYEGDGLRSLISKELSDAIFEAMGKLKLRHRNVLILRCFEQMPYSEIAAQMDCSEMATQVLFYRAKHSLKRQLSKRGFGKGLLLVALGLFGRATAPAEASSVPVNVTATSTEVGLTATVIGAAGTKLGVAVGTAFIAAALTVGGVTALNNNNSGAPGGTGLGEAVFEYPSRVVDACDPDGNGWEGSRAKENLPAPVVPEKWLVGPPPLEQCAVILPTDHWVELEFRGEIVDGPGEDIFLIEWGQKGEQAYVFITDGAGNEYLLGTAMAGISGQQVPTEIGIDISGISLPFVPCAVRILGIDEKGDIPGFDLHSVRARISIGRNDF